MATDVKDTSQIDDLAVNTIRMLSADAVQAAKSGHPGLPMGCADFAYVLFTRFLDFNPSNPQWPDRDRFVLSAGHGSMLLYSLLHLTGYDLPMEQLQNFRQWESMTPGHPEHGDAPGVETTTGPLGQGLGNAVGMALAERLLAARYNTPEHPIVDHWTYVLASDGDLMEGVSHESCSLAGHLRLGKLVVYYDDNHITIEGDTALAYSDDVEKRFQGYGWQVQRVDGHDRDQIDAALRAAREDDTRPSIIIARGTIAFGSPNKAGTHGAHGAPLGEDEIQATREHLGYDYPPFTVPEEVRPLFRKAGEAGAQKNREWDRLFEDYAAKHRKKAQEWKRVHDRRLPDGWQDRLPRFSSSDKPLATRKSSGAVINALAEVLPEFLGGSADLAPSNNTLVDGAPSVAPGEFAGRNLHFGVREHAMGAALNGLTLHGGLRPYGGTFLIFSDYLRPSLRLAALMRQPCIYVFTHDSVFLGEDGPTHQPIEHLPALRAIPHLRVIRPADGNETAAAWALALERTDGPTALCLTRQSVPNFEDTVLGNGVEKGGYVLDRETGKGGPELILIASGSEVHVAREAAAALRQDGVRTRVVSMPCQEIFAEQTPEYREQVLPRAATKRLAVEAASPFGWDRWVGPEGDVVGIERFGASAPWKVIAEKLGFTAENVARRGRELLAR